MAVLAGTQVYPYVDADAGDFGPPSSATFYMPTGLALDQYGNVFVVDGKAARVRGIVLHLLSTDPKAATLREVRRMLNATPPELERFFTAMVGSSAFDGIVANIGAAFLGKLSSGGRELQGILSTAQEQTAPLDDVVRITERSDFKLSDLKDGKTTIYLVLPGMRMGSTSRTSVSCVSTISNAERAGHSPRAIATKVTPCVRGFAAALLMCSWTNSRTRMPRKRRSSTRW